VTPLIEKFTAWAEKNPDLLSKIILIAGAISGLIAVVGTVGLILPGIITLFVALTGPIGIVMAIIAGVVFVVTQCIAIFHLLHDDGALVWEGIKIMINEKIAPIKKGITDFLNAIKLIWETVWGGIRDFFKNIWDAITGTVRDAINSITGFLQPVINMVDNVISKLASIGKSVGSTIGSALGKIGNVLGIHDGIVQNGQIITTDPADYIVATKDPSSLGGGGGRNINININGAVLTKEVATQMGDMIINSLKMQMRF
jgi:phage-related protein